MLYCGAAGYQRNECFRLDHNGTTLESLCVCDEEHLLTGARQLDPDTLSRIHECYYESIYRYARYRVGDGQVAEDAASEVFVRLLDALQNGRAPRRSLRGWLFGTANHIVNDYFRHRYRVQNDNLAEHEMLPTEAETDPEKVLLRSLSHERLRAVITRLTPEQQQVLALRFGQELSHREVAQMLNKSEGAVKLLQFRALQALRRLLEPASG
jgi:RNA polymerase sigma-70 factor (ECF subfamily)